MRIISQEFEVLLIRASAMGQCRSAETTGTPDSSVCNLNNCEDLLESRRRLEPKPKNRIPWGPDPNELQ